MHTMFIFFEGKLWENPPQHFGFFLFINKGLGVRTRYKFRGLTIQHTESQPGKPRHLDQITTRLKLTTETKQTSQKERSQLKTEEFVSWLNLRR